MLAIKMGNLTQFYGRQICGSFFKVERLNLEQGICRELKFIGVMSERNENVLELICNLAKVSVEIENTDEEAATFESLGEFLEMYARK